MASSQMTLTYFEFRGIAEVARLILAYAGKKYKEVTVKLDDWPSVKPATPLEQLPTLEMDGEKYPESLAIWMYLARECGLYPKTHREQLITDVVLGIHLDIMRVQMKWVYLPDGPEKEEKKASAPEQTTKFLAYLESMLAKKGTGYFVGNSITLAEINMLDILTGYCSNSLDYSPEKYPWIAKNNANVMKHEKIAAYIAKRPERPF